MAANKQVIRMLQKQRAKLERMIARAGESISGWKGEMESLVGAITALSGRATKAVRSAAKGRKRGTWKPGGRGRPPQWYVDQQKAKGQKPAKKAAKAKPARKKRKVSAKVLAALAKARAARAAKRSGESG